MILRYTEFGLSHQEVPKESSIYICISGCPNHCFNCHCPELQDPANGEPLWEQLSNIIDLYYAQASCVCLLGEGNCTEEARKELTECAHYITKRGLKSCLYSGRDVPIEAWMACFDYVKVGSYKEKFGSLYNITTNQHFYEKRQGVFHDITHIFWSKVRID